MKNKKRLGEKSIYIEEDLTWTKRKVREKIREKATEIRSKEKETIITQPHKK